MKNILFVTSILSIAIISFALVEINYKYKIKYIDYVWLSKEQKDEMIKSGDYKAGVGILHDVDKAPDGRVLIAGYKTKGSPVGLMTVSNETGMGGPLFYPYPNWNWWNTNECLTGFYRITIKCNYLFVVHSGKFRDRDEVCPARLLVFDLTTDKLIRNIIIPSEIANDKNNNGFLMTPFVDAANCYEIATATVYITDSEGYGIIIYNPKTSKFNRIESSYMKPNHTDFFTIDNRNFTVEEGIFGLTMIGNELYYACTSGKSIYKMDKSDLQCIKNISQADKKTKIVATLSGQVDVLASKENALFFVNIPEGSILCADSSKEINSTNMEILAQDPINLILQCTLKVPGDELIGMANNYQDFVMDRQNINKTNFVIFIINIKDIRKNTKCFGSSKEKNY
ncbi:major royal jelly protein 3-like [Anoplolepis gracilipes]|uniref:major royal jelly protein 3-like n=1 Tax=Anoplolepis gracilipes TaxID=354296 RepID=UPI003BA1C265